MMTNTEIRRLRVLLDAEAADYAKTSYVTDAFVRLDEDSTYSYATEAEILVFALRRAMIPRLQIAYMAYEELIDIIDPSRFDTEAEALIVKARSIVPPIRSYGHDVPFETCVSNAQTFAWFAKTFLDIPNRDAAAIYAKHEWSNNHLARYHDEG